MLPEGNPYLSLSNEEGKGASDSLGRSDILNRDRDKERMSIKSFES